MVSDAVLNPYATVPTRPSDVFLGFMSDDDDSDDDAAANGDEIPDASLEMDGPDLCGGTGLVLANGSTMMGRRTRIVGASPLAFASWVPRSHYSTAPSSKRRPPLTRSGVSVPTLAEPGG
jgi:hypothetical protein